MTSFELFHRRPGQRGSEFLRAEIELPRGAVDHFAYLRRLVQKTEETSGSTERQHTEPGLLLGDGLVERSDRHVFAVARTVAKSVDLLEQEDLLLVTDENCSWLNLGGIIAATLGSAGGAVGLASQDRIRRLLKNASEYRWGQWRRRTGSVHSLRDVVEQWERTTSPCGGLGVFVHGKLPDQMGSMHAFIRRGGQALARPHQVAELGPKPWEGLASHGLSHLWVIASCGTPPRDRGSAAMHTMSTARGQLRTIELLDRLAIDSGVRGVFVDACYSDVVEMDRGPGLLVGTWDGVRDPIDACLECEELLFALRAHELLNEDYLYLDGRASFSTSQAIARAVVLCDAFDEERSRRGEQGVQ